MTDDLTATSSATSRAHVVLLLARSLFHLLSVAAITLWAFTAWPLPLPGALIGVGALVLSVLLWALFLSPKPVLHTDRFGQSLIELVLVGSATAALFALGVPWMLAALFFIGAAGLGYVAGRTRYA